MAHRFRTRCRTHFAFAIAVLACAACGKKDDENQAGQTSLTLAAPLDETPIDVATAPKLAAISTQVTIFDRPTHAGKKVGYLRLGARVARADKPSGTEECAGGWYRIAPRGYVCSGDDVTLDLSNPLARASERLKPDLTRPLPYTYAFVRSVAPLYLRIPTKAEQIQAEFKLEKHLAWWEKKGRADNDLATGANDVEIPGNPAPARPSSTLRFGEKFGAQTGGTSDWDAIPFWLEHGRAIPNVASYRVPPASFFAGRVRRHTGLALIGAFETGDESLDRPFAVTTDLRLVPITKMKPDGASAFHGIELGNDATLPFAFVRGKRSKLPYRSIVRLTTRIKRQDGNLWREVDGGTWVRSRDLGVVATPEEWPDAAKNGEKWVEVSIENQTLTLWEGKKPVYATLVSTGQDGMDNPKTTKSTPRGVFRIKTKHATATMDSNEKSGEASQASLDADPHEEEGAGHRRRGEGLFELRDVPYVAYFEGGYALHSAYWHDVFGEARSHGCVNLAPVDARRVFMWTDPPLPDGWHGVTSETATTGTTVVIHK